MSFCAPQPWGGYPPIPEQDELVLQCPGLQEVFSMSWARSLLVPGLGKRDVELGLVGCGSLSALSWPRGEALSDLGAPALRRC